VSATVFDARLEQEVADVLDQATTEQLGRALVRRIDRLLAAVEDAHRVATPDAGVLVVAGACAMATLSANAARDCYEACRALLGQADVELVNTAVTRVSRALRLAREVEARWVALKAQRGAGAA
jgi:hypothetical protein